MNGMHTLTPRRSASHQQCHKNGCWFFFCLHPTTFSLHILVVTSSHLRFMTVFIHVLFVSNCGGQFQGSMCLEGLDFFASSLWLIGSCFFTRSVTKTVVTKGT